MSDDDDSSDGSAGGGCGCVVIIILLVGPKLATLVWQFLVSAWALISSWAQDLYVLGVRNMQPILAFVEKSPYLAAVLAVGAIVAFLVLWFLISFKFATFRAANRRMQDVPFFFGIFQMVFWDNTEGIVIQRNGRITRVFNDCRGGRSVISRFAGDIVRCRLPTGLRLYKWENSNVLTRDSINLRFRLALDWKIGSIDSYLDTHHKSQSSEAWIDSILEGELRGLVADIGTSSLIDQPGFVRQDGLDQPSPEQVSKRLREALTNPLTLAVSARMKKMGLLLEHLEIQEVGFEESIQKAIDAVWTAQAKPYVGRIEGLAEAEKVKALVEQVGVENAIALVAAQQPNGAMAMALTGLISGAQQFLSRDRKTLRGPDAGAPKDRA